MANLKITDLTSGTALTGTELFESVQSASSVKLTADQIKTFIGITDDTLNIPVARTPATAASTGTTGDICWDSSYIYVCVATDTWKRAGIATW